LTLDYRKITVGVRIYPQTQLPEVTVADRLIKGEQENHPIADHWPTPLVGMMSVDEG
jgi:hypothetical protein